MSEWFECYNLKIDEHVCLQYLEVYILSVWRQWLRSLDQHLGIVSLWLRDHESEYVSRGVWGLSWAVGIVGYKESREHCEFMHFVAIRAVVV